jgi:hypothetical protein
VVPPVALLLPSDGLREGFPLKVGEGGARLGEEDRLIEVGSSAFREEFEARLTIPVASRPRGSVKEESRGEEGALCIGGEGAKVGLPVPRRGLGNDPRTGEPTGDVEK